MKRVLLDTNLLLLLIVGNYDASSIETFKRTRNSSRDDFARLENFLSSFGSIMTTPSVMTEASNLLGNEHFHRLFSTAMIEVCTPFDEIHQPKATIFACQAFERLGFADASLLLAADAETTLLTDDLSLHRQAQFQAIETVNFNHLRMI